MLFLQLRPLIEPVFIAPLAIVGLVLLLLMTKHRLWGRWWRFLTLLTCLVFIVNPVIRSEQREFIPQNVFIFVDQSASQSLENRTQQTQEILDWLKNQIAHLSVDSKHQNRPQPTLTIKNFSHTKQGTTLGAVWQETFAGISTENIAGVFILTDGNIHDTDQLSIFKNMPPVYAVIAGEKQANDRVLTLLKTPAQAVVGKETELVLKADDFQTKNGQQQPFQGNTPLNVSLYQAGKKIWQGNTENGQETRVPLTLSTAGENTFEVFLDADKDETTYLNNQSLFSVQGVRERLKVLLISGVPERGEREWRNLLKSDPMIDLVHFTILRPPGKIDLTPLSELSLIPFPTQMLFEEKLKEFDLIVFENYDCSSIIPESYFEKIAQFAKEGGSILLTQGKQEEPEGFYQVGDCHALDDLLPMKGETAVRQAFTPYVTPIGQRHPVTAFMGEIQDKALNNKEKNHAEQSPKTPWGQWYLYRKGQLKQGRGLVLMSPNTAQDSPLLVLDTVEKGRIAQLNTDQMWLWTRGHQGGGVSSELSKNLIHWLLKEPNLEAEQLKTSLEGDTLTVSRLTLQDQPPNPTVTYNDSMNVNNFQPEQLELSKTREGLFEGKIKLDSDGFYQVKDGNFTKTVWKGRENGTEMDFTLSQTATIKPILDKTKGGAFWIHDKLPSLLWGDEAYLNRGQIVLRQDDSTILKTLYERPLIPWWAMIPFLILLTLYTWRREK